MRGIVLPAEKRERILEGSTVFVATRLGLDKGDACILDGGMRWQVCRVEVRSLHHTGKTETIGLLVLEALRRIFEVACLFFLCCKAITMHVMDCVGNACWQCMLWIALAGAHKDTQRYTNIQMSLVCKVYYMV